jgi:hypothetical protein
LQQMISIKDQKGGMYGYLLIVFCINLKPVMSLQFIPACK